MTTETTNQNVISQMRRVAQLRSEANAIAEQIHRWFEDRYGVSYSDIDCDEIIDGLDYCVGRLPESLAKIDSLMIDKKGKVMCPKQ